MSVRLLNFGVGVGVSTMGENVVLERESYL